MRPAPTVTVLAWKFEFSDAFLSVPTKINIEGVVGAQGLRPENESFINMSRQSIRRRGQTKALHQPRISERRNVGDQPTLKRQHLDPVSLVAAL